MQHSNKAMVLAAALTMGLMGLMAAGCAVPESNTAATDAAPASTLPADGTNATISGVLIDTKCYSMNPVNVANDHETAKGLMPSCATACATMGLPVAVLTADGDAVVLIAPAATFADHMAKETRVTGTMVLGGSMRPDKIEVSDSEGNWSEVEIATMM